MNIKKEIPFLSIRSAAFPNVYLRMYGAKVRSKVDPGAGIVNCQFGALDWERFKFTQYDDETYTIESMEYPGVFLRMDGNGVRSLTDPGAGTVNCQFGAYSYEHFKIHKQGDGSYTIESARFPNVYLRMDGTKVKAFADPGAGTVNCQYTARAWEKFYICAEL